MHGTIEAKPVTEAEKQANTFYARAESLSHHMVGIAATLGASAHLVAIAGSNIISVALRDIAVRDPVMAKQVTDELAQGLIDFIKILESPQNGAQEK